MLLTHPHVLPEVPGERAPTGKCREAYIEDGCRTGISRFTARWQKKRGYWWGVLLIFGTLDGIPSKKVSHQLEGCSLVGAWLRRLPSALVGFSNWSRITTPKPHDPSSFLLPKHEVSHLILDKPMHDVMVFILYPLVANRLPWSV